MNWNLASESLSCRRRSFSFCRLSLSLSAASRSLCTAWLRCSASLLVESDSESCLRICWTEDCAESRRPRTSCSKTKSDLEASSTARKPSQWWGSSGGRNTQKSCFMIIKLLSVVNLIDTVVISLVSCSSLRYYIDIGYFCAILCQAKEILSIFPGILEPFLFLSLFYCMIESFSN